MRLTIFRRARGTAALGLLLLVAAGCSSSEDSDETWTETEHAGEISSPAMGSSSSSMGMSSSSMGSTSSATMGDQEGLAGAVAQNRAFQEKRRLLADQYVTVGGRYTEEGRLREALDAYASALEMDPENKAAQQGYDQVAGLLGRKDKVFAQNWDSVRAGQQQAGALARERFNLGTKAYNEGDYDTALDEFRNTLAILKAQPALNADFDEARVRQAIADAEAGRVVARQKAATERINDIQKIQMEREAEERRAASENVQRIWSNALNAFEREKFVDCARYCDQVLHFDPQHEGATQLKSEARLAKHVQDTERNVTSYREQWQSVLQELKELSVPFGSDPVYPSEDKWARIARRGEREFNAGSVEINEGDAEVRRALEGTMLSSVDWTATPLADALNFIRNNTGVNIIVKAAVDAEVPVEERELNLQFNDISAYSALDLAAQHLKLTFEIRDRMVQITTAADLRRNKIVEFYDVRDLTAPINSFPGGDLNLNPSGVGGGIESFDDGGSDESEETSAVVAIDQLTDMIRNSVDKASWDDDSDNTIADKSGTLVITQTPKNQRAIRKLLNDLRKSIGVQVRIQTRFISVENNFLQDIGVDFRGLGDDSGGVGVPGRGTNVTLDDFGQPGTNLVIGNDLSAGAFYSKEVDVRARTQNLFDLALGNPDVLTPNGGLSLQYAFLGDTQVEAILRAVQKYERVNQVTAPSLTVYNTQRANLQVTRELAYLKDFDVEIAQASVVADPVVDVVREGVVLDVRPIVHSDRRFVTLELRPSVATLRRPIRLFTSSLGVGSGVTIEVPELRKESLKTTVVMPDGGTLLLGGLKFFEEQDYQSGVPILQDIPIVSLLFSRKGKYTNMRDLIVLLKVDVLIMEEHEPTFAGN